MTNATYEGRCFCGSLVFKVSGEPIYAGYCHCQDCRDWGGTPMVSFVMFPYDAFEVVAGEEHLTVAGRVPETPRGWCARCGGHLGVFRSEHEMPHVALSPHVFFDFPFAPTMHVFCGEAVLRLDDDLPHYRDTPESFGGSGELTSSVEP